MLVPTFHRMQATLLALLGAAAAPGGDAAVAPGAGLAAAQWSSHADAALAGASLAALDTAHAARGALGASSTQRRSTPTARRSGITPSSAACTRSCSDACFEVTHLCLVSTYRHIFPTCVTIVHFMMRTPHPGRSAKLSTTELSQY